MRKLLIYLFVVGMAITAVSCKGGNKSSQADTGQTHVGNAGPADSNSYPTTPTETGGKDSSGNGSGNTNAIKDTIKTMPK